MEPYNLWRDEYRREVDQVLDEMRERKDSGEGSSGPLDISDTVVPPAGFYQELRGAKAEVVSLRKQMEIMHEKLERKSLQLEEELRRRNRIKDLVVNLNAHITALEREAQDSKQSAQESLAKSRHCYDMAQQAEARLAEALKALEEEKRRHQQSIAHAEALRASLDELQIQMDAKERDVKSIQLRAEAVEHDAQQRVRLAEARLSEQEQTLYEARQKMLGAEAVEAAHAQQEKAWQERVTALEQDQESLQAQLRDAAAECHK
ncbi:MAG: hypothetical protein WC881_06950, partial [Elusimicrobiota bacterium]